MSTDHKRGLVGTAIQGIRSRVSSFGSSSRPKLVYNVAPVVPQAPAYGTRQRTTSLTSLKSISSSQNHGPGRYQPQSASNHSSNLDLTKLRTQMEQLKAKQADARRRIVALKQERDQLESENRTLQEELSQIDREKRTVNQDLAASLIHAPVEGGMSVQEAITAFKSAMEKVESLIKEIIEHVHPTLRGKLLPLNTYYRHLKSLQTTSPVLFVKTLATANEHMPAESIIFPIIRHLIMYHVRIAVFEGWAPGVSNPVPKDQKILLNLFRVVQKNEAQDRFARWRALTYTHTSGIRTTYHWDKHAIKFVADLKQIVDPLTSQTLLDPDTSSYFRRSTRSMLERVAIFRDSVMKGCTEAEPFVLFPTYQDPFQQTLMQPAMCKKPIRSVPKYCVLALSIGLQMGKNVPDDRPGRPPYRTIHVDAVPANVVTELPFDSSIHM